MNYVYGDGCTNVFFIDNLNEWKIFRKRGDKYSEDVVYDKNNLMRKDMSKKEKMIRH